MEASEPLLSPERKENAKRCFICFRFLKNSKKCSGIGGEGLDAFRNQAASWSQINIPFELKEHSFTEMLKDLTNKPTKKRLLFIQRVVLALDRSSHRRCSLKKGGLGIFAKFTGKHLCQSLFLIKLQVEACNFIKKEALAQVFFCEFCEISKNTFFTEHLRETACV